jgi:hypothetical protein
MKKKLNKNGQKEEQNKVIKLNNWGRDLISEITNAYNIQINEIIEYYSGIPPKDKNQLIKNISRMVIYDEIKDVRIRIGLIKFIIGLIPYSINLIEKILRLNRNKYDYELHFTLFCYIDNIVYTKDEGLITRLTKVLIYYLKNVKTSTAKAAWMAGHLLGDHWPTHKALPALIEIVRSSGNRIGREAAISGLGELYKRINSKDKKTIISILKDIAKQDPSKEVRLLSEVIINLKK